MCQWKSHYSSQKSVQKSHQRGNKEAGRTLQWRHNERDGVSNHLDCLINRLFRGIHRPPVDSPHKGSVTRKCFHLMTTKIRKKGVFLPKALWPTGIVIACVCVCVFVCQLLLVRAITHHPLELGSLNLDQKMQNILLKVPIVLGLIKLINLSGQI